MALLKGLKSADKLLGMPTDDVIFGRAGADTLDGGFGDDVIFGNRGADVLIGGYGDDVLIGGAGRDQFAFSIPPQQLLDEEDAGRGIDRIMDFEPGRDSIMVAVPFGDIADFTYDRSTGALFVDVDGSGGFNPIQIAELRGDLRLRDGDVIFA